MKTNDMLASIEIDGQKLKAAREAKDQTILEMAASLTLSRDQVKAIEEGGDKPFYTPAHKLLAVRKYANALGIPYDDVVTGEGADLTIAAPEDAPPAMHVHVAQPAVASELRMAAVARNAEIRRQTLIAAGILCVLLALYAKVRGNDDDIGTLQEQSALAVEMPDYVDKTPAVHPAPPDLEAKLTTQRAAAVPVTSVPADAVPAIAAAVAAETGNNEGNCPHEQAGTDLKTWSPAYQRKSDPKLYLISPRGGSLCVADVSGNAKRIILKPMVGQTIAGKPPYTVRAENLMQVEMYLQGLRVKVPSETTALRLIPTRNTQPQPAEPAPANASDA